MSRSGSVKGGSAKGSKPRAAVAPDTSAVSFMCNGAGALDLVGSDGMVVDMTFLSRTGVKITLKPDGRKCRCCPFKDSDWDPVALKIERKKRPMKMAKPPKEDGTTIALHCFYCIKHWAGRIKRSRVPNITLSEYETTLGTGDGIEFHVMMVRQMIASIIMSGGNAQMHIHWDVLESRCLKFQHAQKMIKKRPGFQHYSIEDYRSDHGDLETNGNKEKGHRYWTLDGIFGVLVPGKRITSIEFSEELSALMESEVVVHLLFQSVN